MSQIASDDKISSAMSKLGMTAPLPNLDDSQVLKAILVAMGNITGGGGGGGGSGTVTSVSVTTQNGVSATVTNPTTTPALAFTLGAITPTSVNGNTITAGTGTLTLAAGKTLTASNTITLAGTDGSSLNIGAGGTLGTMATQAASAVAITGGTISGTTINGVTLSGGGYTLTVPASGTAVLLSEANLFTVGQTISATTSLLLGTAGSAVGNIGFRNATSGTATLAPPTGALGTYTVTLPSVAGALATLGGAQTFTGQQTFAAGSVGAPTLNFPLGGGVYADATGVLISAGSALVTRFDYDAFVVANNQPLGFSSGTTYNSYSTAIRLDSAGVLGLRKGATAHSLRAYGTYTDASNYVRLALNTTSTTMGIACERAGTGAANIDLGLTPAGTGLVCFGTHSAIGVELVTGYITIKDSGGTSRKIAVIS